MNINPEQIVLQMNATQKLIIISPGFPKDESDSTCLVALQMLVRALQDIPSVQLEVLAMHYPFEKKTYLWHGTTVHALGGANRKGLSRIFLFARTWFLLKNLYKKNRGIPLFSFLATDAALVAGLFSHQHGLQHVCWMVGQDTRKENHYMRFIPRSTRFVAISSFSKQHAESNFGIHVEAILHNALNLQVLPPYENLPRTCDLLFVGSLIPLKHPEWILRLIGDLKQDGLSPVCDMIGTGPMKSELQKDIEALGLKEHIRLWGELSHEAVLQHMFRSRILVHPSEFEGFSTVCLEALYAGCKVVTTFSPFTENIVDIHTATDYGAFYAQCRKVLQSTWKPQSRLIYNTDQTAQQLVNLLQGSKK
ncbi:MAG TPA: glycosyltransferase family 4 protein [Bacteroidia bacterium]|nr:glycosyltransferase family 4 protein [Bacteroidia bacterium]